MENWKEKLEKYGEYSFAVYDSEEDKKTYTCCICGEKKNGYGNNPYPVVKDEDAECCDDCNAIYVIPARIKAMRENN